MTTTRRGYAPAVDERRFVPRSLDEARLLYEDLMEHGTTGAVARSIVGTLQTLPSRYSDAFGVKMVRYRKELAKLDGPPWERVGSPRSVDAGAYNSTEGAEVLVTDFSGWRSAPELALAS